jgi:class 3 adenylate cyclase
VNRRVVPVWGIAAIAGFGLALDAAYVVFVMPSGVNLVNGIVLAILAAAYLISGALAWRRSPRYRTGPLLVLVGYLVLVSPLARFPDAGAVYAIGSAYGGIHESVLAYLLLTYPSGRATGGIIGWSARGVVAVAIAVSTLDLLTRDTVAHCLRTPCASAPNPFMVVDLGTLAAQITGVLFPIVGLTVLALVAWRYLEAKGATRRVLAPVLVAGALGATAIVLRAMFAYDPFLSATVRGVQILIPVALGIGFIRSRLARAGVAELLVTVGPNATMPQLQDAIRRALHDPSAQLMLAGPREGDVDIDGELVASPPDGDGEREITPLASGGQRMGAIVHDPVLNEEAGLVSSVAAATRIVLENSRLAASIRAQAADVARLPMGVVTLLYTDVERSTELLDELQEELFDETLEELRRLMRAEIRRAGGREIDSIGDEFFAVIPEAPSAIHAALGIQRATTKHPWPRGARVRVRMGLHTGSPERGAASYIGMDVHVAARIGSAGSGGQIVVSDATRAATEAGLTDGAVFIDLGWFRLKGVPVPTRLHQLTVTDLPASFPPLRNVEQVVPASVHQQG